MLVSCVAYQDGKKLADIQTKDIGEYVRRQDCLVWVALYNPEPAELEEMQDKFDLHELAVEDAHHGHQRPKIEEYGDSLFVVLHTIESTTDEVHVGEIDVFIGKNYVLSVRHRSERGFAEVRARCEREPELLRYGSGFVLYALMDAVVDRYFPVLDALEDELDLVEEKIFSGSSPRANIEALYALKQKLMALQHVVRPLLDATGKLHGGRVPPICVGTQDYYRDVSDHLLRINQTIDSVRDMATTAISVNLSLITLQENETTKRLASYAALVAVPTMVAGIYGMNFRNMPELSWEFGYPIAIGIMAAIDVYLFYRFRKAAWL
ncbi:MAG: magnesium/cobalt transporter CorA [Burkholderiales bacterium]|nr:magnesium/cobalt transporter CorA [Burkholderiales bacterium]